MALLQLELEVQLLLRFSDSKPQPESSEVGTLRTVGLQRSSVQPTTKAFSESISNVNLSFCT